jgi:hypothetical protein
MNRENLGWFVAGAILVMAATMGAGSGVPGVGRYQLVASRCIFPKSVDPEQKERPITYRIDTVDGSTYPLNYVEHEEWPEQLKKYPDLIPLLTRERWGFRVMEVTEAIDVATKAITEAGKRDNERRNQK